MKNVIITYKKRYVCSNFYETDPSAGSPTDTLLRLLLPLDNVI